MTLTADDSREMSYLQTAGKADGMEQPSDVYVALCVQHSPKVGVWWKVIHTFYKWILIHGKYGLSSAQPPGGRG
jgi:hypothetical protein